MAGLESLQAVQFVTMKGKRYAMLRKEDWDALTEWLESLEDIDIGKKALAKLEAAGNDRARAGWIAWDEARRSL